MAHNTKINAIFVHVKADDRSVPVHICDFKFSSKYSKIVT